VTYRHDGVWTGPYPEFAEQRMPRTIAKLRQRQPLKVVFYGDSITAGASASVQTMEPPYQPAWADLMVQMLRDAYHAPITSRNRALGGTRSDWGATHAKTLVAAESPDLCVIAFGMNDRASVAPAQFEANLRAILAAVRKTRPEAEFILVSSMLNNPEWSSPDRLWEYRAALYRLAGPGVIVADLTGVHRELLRRKDYIAMSGNNLNHPNDYLVQWYAQFIAALLTPPSTPSPAP
jgi:lysophospholipase L1-like esterase